ncbi:hypothetical protein Q4512_00480 [Oceanihabitans sp. 2_MG-2023]|uniref:hypothetical protein n=1 Tax=Oceanihabitans sp. 2_MG-2023 TaxID=3062661 RepID=UPI0026E231F4|nr:hypothetical protein [Oceanihabitans sp. 2_MG-2023]MDO6595365.1 hypothetical protein [Oceanihabitans sp. 2_MG-2023]
MKVLKLTVIVAFSIIILQSCGGNSAKQPATANGFLEIQKDIKNEFGDDAYYTDLTITYNKSLGNIIGVTVTKDPVSLKMGQWNQTKGIWKQNQEISLEVPQGTQASDFMFQLDENINLSILGELAEKATGQLKTDKNIENPTLSMAFIKFPKNGDVSKTEYTVMLKPENGGTTFTFKQGINDNSIKIDY